ncbi:MAG TPA: signal peptide peptidase SppA, partial [Rickettsiales bacterium]|nr:signal peptide peptidase SppA [Rickettsiales bacterium]
MTEWQLISHKMSDLSNNIAILSYLKDKVHKWKNIAIMLGVVVILLIVKMLLGNNISGKIETGNYIANIKIEGAIFADDFRTETLQKISNDNSAKAVIVNIDSPGGGVVDSEILYNNLRKIAKTKPLVVVMHSLAASGGYMAAIASDHIIAHNGTLTGSIGVLMQSAEMVDLANKIGVKFNIYKSASFKAAPSPFERSNTEIDMVVQESIKDSADFFFGLVKERRGAKLNKSQFSKIFDGRVFTGRQALVAGLVDEVGDTDLAMKYLKEKHKIDENTTIRDVKIIKIQNKLFEKFIGFLPFANLSNSAPRQGISAI